MTNKHTFAGKALAIGLAGTLVLVVGAKKLDENLALKKETPKTLTNQMLAFELPKGDFVPVEKKETENNNLPLNELVAILPAPFVGLELQEAEENKGKKGRRR